MGKLAKEVRTYVNKESVHDSMCGRAKVWSRPIIFNVTSATENFFKRHFKKEKRAWSSSAEKFGKLLELPAEWERKWTTVEGSFTEVADGDSSVRLTFYTTRKNGPIELLDGRLQRLVPIPERKARITFVLYRGVAEEFRPWDAGEAFNWPDCVCTECEYDVNQPQEKPGNELCVHLYTCTCKTHPTEKNSFWLKKNNKKKTN
jgi:hypothetical protein